MIHKAGPDDNKLMDRTARVMLGDASSPEGMDEK